MTDSNHTCIFHIRPVWLYATVGHWNRGQYRLFANVQCTLTILISSFSKSRRCRTRVEIVHAHMRFGIYQTRQITCEWPTVMTPWLCDLFTKPNPYEIGILIMYAGSLYEAVGASTVPVWHRMRVAPNNLGTARRGLRRQRDIVNSRWRWKNG